MGAYLNKGYIQENSKKIGIIATATITSLVCISYFLYRKRKSQNKRDKLEKHPLYEKY
jgi:hypothetical protein